MIIFEFVPVLGGSGVERGSSPLCICCFQVIALEPSGEGGVNSLQGDNIYPAVFFTSIPYFLWLT